MSKERDRLRAVLAEADELIGKMQAVAASHGYESFRALVEDLYRAGKQKMRSLMRCAQCGIPSATYRCSDCNEKHAKRKRIERSRARA